MAERNGVGAAAGRRPKVERVAEAYDLSDLPDALVRRWTATGTRRQSLRELARHFNREVLRAAMTGADISTLDGDVENVHRLLTDEAVTTGTRIQAERRLERQGLDVDAVRRDFVSHQTVYTYLTDHRGIEPPNGADDADRLERDRETIERLRNRLVAVTENTLETLDSTDRLDLTAFRVLVDVHVLCEACGTQYTVGDLFENGGCDCDADPRVTDVEL